MTLACLLLIAALTASLLRAHHRLVLVAQASHELRGPISAVQLGLHGLAGEPARLAAIDLELRRAGRALEDLAAARRGARGRSGAERIDLAALTREYESAWRSLAAAHGASLRVEPPIVVLPFAVGGGDPIAPLTVFADPLRVAQACANLVGNAAEHGGGAVRIRVSATRERVRVEVADDGPGLPAPISVLTTSGRLRHGRRGHGLAITSAIARHHGGRLIATESGVTLELPAAGHRRAEARGLPTRLRALVRRSPAPQDLAAHADDAATLDELAAPGDRPAASRDQADGAAPGGRPARDRSVAS